MFFAFSIVALLCWSGSDLFSKLGTKQDDKLSEWKVIFAVGLIMGIHAVLTLIGGMFINEETTPKWICSLFYTDFKFIDLIHYFPIAFIYLSAMVIGYKGLRYIELSVSSPICNSSGSLALLICVLFGLAELDLVSGIGCGLVAIGILSLGFTEYFENDEARMLRQQKSQRKYTKSVIAILIPVIYLIIDALGTVGDQFIAEKELFGLSDYASNTAFEFTSLLIGLFGLFYVKVIKKEKFFTKNKYLYYGGLCETLGQVFYMAVMFSDFSAGMAIISAYCAVSVLWSRIFLKEKLSLMHYVSIIITFLGIVLLGVFSPV